MLSFLIIAVSTLLPLSYVVAVMSRFGDDTKSKIARVLILTGGLLGLVLSCIIAFVRRTQAKQMLKSLVHLNRQAIALTWILLLLFLLIVIIYQLCQSSGRKRRTHRTGFLTILGAVTGGLVLIFMAVTVLPVLFAQTNEFIAFGEDSFGTASLLRVMGLLTGILIAFMACLANYKILNRSRGRSRWILFILFVLALNIDYALRGISALARLRILSSQNDLIFNIMIFEDKSLPYVGAMYLLVTLIAAVVVFLANLKLRGDYPHSAARRKERWRLRNCRRWSVTAVIFATLIFLTVSPLHAYVNRPVVLTPPQPYQEEGNKIVIPLSDVDDGHLHRFSYSFEEHDIRFLVVRKPQGNAYGVGLDACDICGVAGYFERNHEVICKRCDVVMNKATIGFKGGCNPVPFPYEIKDAKIYIDKADLQAEKDRFPIGD